MEGDDPAAELNAMSLAFRAAALLARHMPAPGPLAVEADRRSLSLRRMLGHVQRHYGEKLCRGRHRPRRRRVRQRLLRGLSQVHRADARAAISPATACKRAWSSF